MNRIQANESMALCLNRDSKGRLSASLRLEISRQKGVVKQYRRVDCSYYEVERELESSDQLKIKI